MQVSSVKTTIRAALAAAARAKSHTCRKPFQRCLKLRTSGTAVARAEAAVRALSRMDRRQPSSRSAVQASCQHASRNTTQSSQSSIWRSAPGASSSWPPRLSRAVWESAKTSPVVPDPLELCVASPSTMRTRTPHLSSLSDTPPFRFE
eukprot:UN1211